MNTLDTVIQEVIKRSQAAGTKADIEADAPIETKLAFLQSYALSLGLHFS